MHITEFKPYLEIWNEKEIILLKNVKEQTLYVKSKNPYVKSYNVTKGILIWVNPNEFILLNCIFDSSEACQKMTGKEVTLITEVSYFKNEMFYPHYLILYLRKHVNLLKEINSYVEKYASEMIQNLKKVNMDVGVFNAIHDTIEELENVTEEQIKEAEQKEKQLKKVNISQLNKEIKNHIKHVTVPQKIENLKKDIDRSLDERNEKLFYILTDELNKYSKESNS